MAKKKNRIIYIDDEEYVWCSLEKDFVINTKFDRNEYGVYKMFCMECSTKTYQDRHKSYVEGSIKRKELDIEESKIILKNLGYNLNSEYTVYEQFLIKHKLT